MFTEVFPMSIFSSAALECHDRDMTPHLMISQYTDRLIHSKPVMLDVSFKSITFCKNTTFHPKMMPLDIGNKEILCLNISFKTIITFCKNTTFHPSGNDCNCNKSFNQDLL